MLEEYIKKIYKLLHSGHGIGPIQDAAVRKQALLVIMHLILNGMLKLKGEIVDILMLLLDDDEEIGN